MLFMNNCYQNAIKYYSQILFANKYYQNTFNPNTSPHTTPV